MPHHIVPLWLRPESFPGQVRVSVLQTRQEFIESMPANSVLGLPLRTANSNKEKMWQCLLRINQDLLDASVVLSDAQSLPMRYLGDATKVIKDKLARSLADLDDFYALGMAQKTKHPETAHFTNNYWDVLNTDLTMLIRIAHGMDLWRETVRPIGRRVADLRKPGEARQLTGRLIAAPPPASHTGAQAAAAPPPPDGQTKPAHRFGIIENVRLTTPNRAGIRHTTVLSVAFDDSDEYEDVLASQVAYV